jgi:4-amino-4-deoxy-L-arabinose transferase-like glycosyltransferase
VAEDIVLEIGDVWTIVLIGILIVAFALQLLVSLNSPVVFGDEGFHLRMAQWIAEKLEYPKYFPFSGSELQKSGYYRGPIWEFLVASLLIIFGGSDSIVKIATPFIATVLAGLITFLLVKRLYEKKTGFFASVLFVTISSIITYSVLFYDVSLYVLYFSAFILTLILAIEEDNKKYYLLSGLFGGLAFTTKALGVVVPPIVFLVFIYQIFKEKKPIAIWKKYLFLVIPMVVLGGSFMFRNVAAYGTICNLPVIPSIIEGSCYVNNYKPVYEFKSRTEQTGTEQSVFNLGIANYLNFAYGNIWLVPFSFLTGIVLLIKDLDRKNIIILIALLFLVYTIISPEFGSRAEDAARYSVGFAPIIALVSAIFFVNLYEFLEKNYKYLGLGIVLFVLFLGYTNFSEKLTTMGSVKQFSPLFLEACEWVKQNTAKDIRIMTVWVWHTAYNCQRNVIGNLADLEMSQDLNFSLETAKKLGITHIFIQKFSLSNEYLSERYNVNFVQFLENNPNCFKKIYENGLPLQECLNQGGCDGNILYEINKECLK